MKLALVKTRSAKPDLPDLHRVLPQIQTLIEASRQHGLFRNLPVIFH